MESLFREDIWAEIQKEKETGALTEYTYNNELGTVRYLFFKREAGCVGEQLYYDIATYRGAEGPYINCIAEGKEKELLSAFLEDFAQYCESNRIIAEFAKLDPWDRHSKIIREVLNAEYYGNFYCNDLTRDFYSLDYNRRSKRSIRKAREMGVTVLVDEEGKTIPDFVRLYQNTEEKYHTNDYYNFSESDMKLYFDKLKGRCFLINAVVDGKIITSVFAAYGKNILHYLYLGNDPDYLAYQGNSLLTYETSLLGQRLGLKLFDMGGGKPGGNIEGFKRNFISDDGVWEYYAVKKIWNKDIYDILLSRKKVISNQNICQANNLIQLQSVLSNSVIV